MPDYTVNIYVSGDAQDAIKALRESGVALDDFDDKAKHSSKSSATLGDAMDALGLPSLTAAAGIALLVGGIKGSVQAAREGELAQAQLLATLQSTGGAAGMTAGELNKLAFGLMDMSNYDDDAIIGAETLLLTFTKIGREVFPQATQAVLDISAKLGQDLKNSSIQVGKALNDPIEGVSALRRVGVSFTEDQEKMIETLVRSGDIVGAQTVILKELETEFGGSAAAAREADAGITAAGNAMGVLQGTIGELLLPTVASFNQQVIIAVEGWNTAIVSLQLLIKAHEDLEATQREGVLGFLDFVGAADDWFAKINPLAALIGNLRDITIDYLFDQENLAKTLTDTEQAAQDLALSLQDQIEDQEALVGSIEKTIEIVDKLFLTQAGYITGIDKLEEGRVKQTEKFNQQMIDSSVSTNETLTSNETKKQEALAKLLEQYQSERNRVISSGQMSVLSTVDSGYQKEKQRTIEHYDEMNAEVRAKGAEKQQALIEQQRKEDEDYQKHLEELRLKTVLSMLETTGQLDKLTGGVTNSSKDAFALIQAGLIPVTGEFQTAIAAYNQQLGTASTNYRKTQEQNTAAVDKAFSGTLAVTDKQIAQMGLALPSASGTAKSALVRDFDQANRTLANTKQQLDTLTQTMVGMESQARRTASAVSSIQTGGSRPAGFAQGGSFIVPGSGGGDRPYLLNLTPGEHVQVTPRGQVNQSNVYNQQQFQMNINGGQAMGAQSEFEFMQAAAGAR